MNELHSSNVDDSFRALYLLACSDICLVLFYFFLAIKIWKLFEVVYFADDGRLDLIPKIIFQLNIFSSPQTPPPPELFSLADPHFSFHKRPFIAYLSQVGDHRGKKGNGE